MYMIKVFINLYFFKVNVATISSLYRFDFFNMAIDEDRHRKIDPYSNIEQTKAQFRVFIH